MSEAKSIEDLDDALVSTPEGNDVPEEPTKPVVDKDTRRRLEDALEERRLKKAIEDDYSDV
jgi:hypothetical protein